MSGTMSDTMSNRVIQATEPVKPMTNYNRNPNGIGGYRPGQPSANPGGRPKGSSAVQLRCLQYCGEAVDVLRDIMRGNEGSKSDALLECAPNGGQFAGWELTGAAGLSEDESHGQAPYP